MEVVGHSSRQGQGRPYHIPPVAEQEVLQNIAARGTGDRVRRLTWWPKPRGTWSKVCLRAFGLEKACNGAARCNSGTQVYSPNEYPTLSRRLPRGPNRGCGRHTVGLGGGRAGGGCPTGRIVTVIIHDPNCPRKHLCRKVFF